MAPSEKFIISTIKTKIEEIFGGPDREKLLTVRYVRDVVEEDLGLVKGFLSEEDWKTKSKALIKEYAQKLIDSEAEPAPTAVVVSPAPKKQTPKKVEAAKKGTKRSAAKAKAPPKKRRKRSETPSDDEEPSDESVELSPSESEASDFGDTESDAPKRKSKSKASARQQSKKAESSEDEDDDVAGESEESDEPKRKKKAQAKTKTLPGRQSKSKAVVESKEEEEQLPSPKKKATPKKSEPKPNTTNISPKNNFTKAPLPDRDLPSSQTVAVETYNGSDSEMSVLLDEHEPVKPKQKRLGKSDSIFKADSKPKSSTASKPPKSKPKEATLSPDEETIRTLQTQLRKCGLNKIWAFELKNYSTNSEKIKHLQNMLRDVGMKGRFSEARAREIKEMRELQADLEAVKEGEKSWGLGGRGSRNKERKNLRVESESEDEGDAGKGAKDVGKAKKNGGGKAVKNSDSESESESEQPQPRNPRGARAALAFLDDFDEDSDD